VPDESPARDGTAPVSVVIAVYDGEATIGDAIASVLTQTLPPLEIIVVDDGSQDGTPAVLDRIAKAHACLRWLRQERNGGQAAALNRGVSAARGAFLAFLDADDVWMPDKLARQLARFAADPALDVVFGLAKQRWVRPGEAAREGPPVPARLPGAMLIRRAAFDRVGPFETRWRLGSVVDWYARAVDAKLRMDLIQEVVYERRIHGRNLGIVAAEHRADYLEVVKAALDRRRRGDT
jgi:glycosyltransferase involved in cell wall biosynthesis